NGIGSFGAVRSVNVPPVSATTAVDTRAGAGGRVELSPVGHAVSGGTARAEGGLNAATGAASQASARTANNALKQANSKSGTANGAVSAGTALETGVPGADLSGAASGSGSSSAGAGLNAVTGTGQSATGTAL